ncbi:hypothetical protein [Alicyclobacillus pomorum]|uniref:hypothetical protein n=1 Tax=Alicyclobacillus pomorum TaxID=204470 RepID=UPI0004002AF3|nr:hypothetical protein [Alicyclobacillus pomorum]
MQRFALFAILVIVMFCAGFVLSSALNAHQRASSKVSFDAQAPSFSVIREM